SRGRSCCGATRARSRSATWWYLRRCGDGGLMLPRDPYANPIDYEILQEKAATLARTSEKLEAALAALAAVERQLAEAPGEELQGVRAQLLEQAAEWLWYAVVQREAVGLTSHDALFETYR